MPKYIEIAKKVDGDLILPEGSYEDRILGTDFVVERHVDARGIKAEAITLWRGYIGGWFLGEGMKVYHTFDVRGVEIGGALDLQQAYIGRTFEIGSELIFRKEEVLKVYSRVGEEFHAPRLKGGRLEFYGLKVGRNLNLNEVKADELHLSGCEIEGMFSLRNSRVKKLDISEGRCKILDLRGSKIKKFYATGFPKVEEVLVDSETELPRSLVDLLLFYFPDNEDLKRVRVRK